MIHASPTDLLTIARLARLFERNCGPELSLAQYRTLGNLVDGGERATRLAALLSMPKPTLTALVDGLVARGFIVRDEARGDRRGVQVSITPAGRAAHEVATDHLAAVFDEVLGRLPDAPAVLAAIGDLGDALDDRLADVMALEGSGPARSPSRTTT